MCALRFSDVSRGSVLGRVLRAPLALVPKGLAVPVLQGPGRGLRWVVGAHVHGCWLGSYEAEKVSAFVAAIPPGGVVFDIGANVGYYTLLASRRVGHRGTVVSFEPLPRNIGLLEHHLRLNGVGNVQVRRSAVADVAGEARFDDSAGAAEGGLSSAGGLVVQVEALDELMARRAIPWPQVVKMDVEGAEARVLRGGRTLFSGERPPVVFLATHGPEVHRERVGLLRGWGYDVAGEEPRPGEHCAEVVAVPRRRG